jgi:hypothetical protein
MDDKKEWRGGGLKAAAGAVRRAAKPALGKRGFAAADLIARWGEVMGADLARHTCPMRIAWQKGKPGDATLHLLVASGAQATLVQHLVPLILERVNGFLGYRGIARLALTQGPLPPRPQAKAPPPRPLRPEETAELEGLLAAVADPEMKATLAALGAALIRRRGE